MDKHGYDIKTCDVCSVKSDGVIDNKESVLFKFVHYSTPTMATEPYFKIEFLYN